jgi:phage terminase large subunit
MAIIQIPNNWKPRDYQLKAWNYLESGGNHAELIWHRRAGKDDVCLNWAAVAAFTRQASYWHMLPQAAQARKAIWDSVNPHTGKKRIDEAFPLELRKSTRNQEMIIEFINGSTWQVVGSDNFNSLVGSAPAGIVYSEWALANPNARVYLRPIIAENHGWQLFITTPRGRNHAYTTLKAAEKDPSSFAQILTAYDTGVFDYDRLEAERQSYINEFGLEYGEAKFEQEYLCSFDSANLGSILARSIGKLEQIGRINDGVEYDPLGSDIFISADIGRRDTATWYFWQPKIGGYSIIDHDSGWGIDAEEWCERLSRKLSDYVRPDGKSGLGIIYLPHDAKAKTFAAKHSAHEIFSRYFGFYKVKITPNSSISDRVNAARTLIMKCEFNETKCKTGLDGLKGWAYEYDEEKKIMSQVPKHDFNSHEGDGFSYGCVIINTYKPIVKQVTAPKFWNEQKLDELWVDNHKKQNRL